MVVPQKPSYILLSHGKLSQIDIKSRKQYIEQFGRMAYPQLLTYKQLCTLNIPNILLHISSIDISRMLMIKCYIIVQQINMLTHQHSKMVY